MEIQSFLNSSGTLIWTMTTNGYKYYTWNLYISIQKLNLPWKLCIVCLDKSSHRFFRDMGIEAIHYKTALPEGNIEASRYDTRSFHITTRYKLELMDIFCKDSRAKMVIYLDGDIIVKKDFVKDLETNCKERIWYFQCDENSQTPCTNKVACPNFCTGFIACKTPRSPNPFTVIESKWDNCKGNNDQEYVQKEVRFLGQPFETLSRDLYPNGKMIFAAKDPLLRHYNYRVSSAKKVDMKKAKDWLLPYPYL